MASTYTTNLGIEKPATGEQSGTWGATTNTNFDILDQAIGGIEAVTLSTAGSSGSPTALPITDGAVSTGRNKYIEFVDGGDLGATAYVQLTPNDSEKVVYFRNSLSGSRSILIFQGTYSSSRDIEIPNGKDVVLKFDGGGSTAIVTYLQANEYYVGNTQLVGNLDVDNININGNTISSTDTNGNINLSPNGTGVVALSSTDLTFGDNDKAIFGAGSDLQIYHDGINSYIDDAGIGGLFIRGSELLLQKYTGEAMIYGVADSFVKLYYDNAEKLSTTATGVDVTGGLTTTGAVSTTARDGAIVDYSSTISRFVAGRSGGAYGQWEAHVAGASGVTKRYQIDYDGTTRWYAADGTTERMRINSDGSVVINNTGGDAQLYFGGTSGTSRMYLARTGSDAILWNVSNGNLRFGTNNSEAMRITSGGSLLVGTTSAVVSGTTYAFEVKNALPAIFMADSTATSLTYGGVNFYRPVNAAGNGNGFSLGLNNSSSAQAEYGYIGAVIEDNTAGAQDGALLFSTSVSGTRTERLRISSGGILTYNSDPTSGGGVNVSLSASYNDTINHTVGGVNSQSCALITINTSNGATQIPVYRNGGAGVAYDGTMLDPDNNTWVALGTSITFNQPGSFPQTFVVSITTGGSALNVQRTSGINAYSVFVQLIG